jgi:hypothetical protein
MVGQSVDTVSAALRAHPGAAEGGFLDEDDEQLGSRVGDVHAVGGTSAGEHPEQPPQRRHVVDGQPVGVPERGPDGGGPWLVLGGCQRGRDVRRGAPPLPVEVPLVRWAAGLEAAR